MKKDIGKQTILCFKQRHKVFAPYLANVLLRPSVFFRLMFLALLSLVFVFQQQSMNTIQTAASSSTAVSYHVVGKHILDIHNNVFIPYGVLIDGILLAQPDWKTDGALIYDTFDQMQAAHDFWHSNTVRLQIGSKALFAQSPYDSSYLAKIDHDVQWATQLGMNIIITLQYQGYGNSGQQMPTQDAIHFWDVIAPHYAHNQQVFFDIFNEPKTNVILGHTDNDASWSFWQNGGAGIDGKTYVGMQQLVNAIRGLGVQNLIFAEGLAAGEDIRLLPEHTLTGSNIVYAIHPYLGTNGHSTPAGWNYWFGKTTTTGNFPVVADEWGEYQSSKEECIPDAPTVVPQFLTYLKSHQIGLIGYAFWPGTLIRDWNFRDPTTYMYSTTLCNIDTSIHPNLAPNAEGAGELIRQYLIANSNRTVTPSQPPVTTPAPSAQSFLLPLMIGVILLILLASIIMLLFIRRRLSK